MKACPVLLLLIYGDDIEDDSDDSTTMTRPTLVMTMTMISMMMILGEHNIRAEIETLFLLTLHGQCCFDVSPLYIKNNKKLHKSQPKKSNKIINWV